MGDVIRAGAAVDEILKDGRAAMNKAVATNGTVKERAQQGLGPALTVVDAIETELAAAREALVPLAAALDAENDRADAEVARIYDEIWNDVGRPAQDRYLALLFPGGAGHYTDGDTAAQPTRMELLAKLLERKLHPKLTKEACDAYATRVRGAAAELQADIDAVAGPAATVALLTRVRTALARTVQFELASLKRSYKNDGMSEAAIHEILPDRPVSKKPAKKGAASPAPAPVAPTPEPT